MHTKVSIVARYINTIYQRSMNTKQTDGTVSVPRSQQVIILQINRAEDDELVFQSPKMKKSRSEVLTRLLLLPKEYLHLISCRCEGKLNRNTFLSKIRLQRNEWVSSRGRLLITQHLIEACRSEITKLESRLDESTHRRHSERTAVLVSQACR